MAWLLFGEAFTALMVLGMLITAAGVAMVVRDERMTQCATTCAGRTGDGK